MNYLHGRYFLVICNFNPVHTTSNQNAVVRTPLSYGEKEVLIARTIGVIRADEHIVCDEIIDESQK